MKKIISVILVKKIIVVALMKKSYFSVFVKEPTNLWFNWREAMHQWWKSTSCCHTDEKDFFLKYRYGKVFTFYTNTTAMMEKHQSKKL